MTLVETLQRRCADAAASLKRAEAAAATDALDPDAVVAVTAALDGCYYALLEHGLTCAWDAAVVPPPHLWFPAMTAVHPGVPYLPIRDCRTRAALSWVQLI